ncbi:MAG: hypothetical protein Q4B43_05575 [Bacteroidota bacterium]|nr:hypothetical protein [Bacteroidota bacterium]
MELKKEVSGYADNADNYAIEKELTVNITLNEYRKLVKNNAVSEDRYNNLQDENWRIKKENEKLRKETEILKNEIIEARRETNTIGILNNESEEI